MHRIDTDTKAEDLHGSGKHGFTEGNPVQGVAATDLSADWCNAVQEEASHVIEHAGLTLDKNDNTQLRQAVEIIAGSRSLAMANWRPIVGSAPDELYAVGHGGASGYGDAFVAVDAPVRALVAEPVGHGARPAGSIRSLEKL